MSHVFALAGLEQEAKMQGGGRQTLIMHGARGARQRANRRCQTHDAPIDSETYQMRMFVDSMLPSSGRALVLLRKRRGTQLQVQLP